jgi:hypothetical protein
MPDNFLAMLASALPQALSAPQTLTQARDPSFPQQAQPNLDTAAGAAPGFAGGSYQVTPPRGLPNLLGKIGTDAVAQLPTAPPIMDALARNALKPRPEEAAPATAVQLPYAHVPHGIRNVLGMVGDALLVANGHQPMYRPRLEQMKSANALAALQANPHDGAALAGLYAVNPDLAMRMEDQLYQREERQRSADARTAASDYLLGTSPDAESRLVRADPEGFLTFRGKQLDMTAKQLKSINDLHNSAMQILGGVHDQESYDAAKQRIGSLYGDVGLDASALKLPDTYSPDTIHGLQMEGMDTSKQLAAIARENRVKIYGANTEADNARADRNLRSLETYRNRMGSKGQGAGKASGGPKNENALYTSIMSKWTAGQPVNAQEREFVRAYELRHGGAPKRGRGGVSAGNGAIIRNPKTGERMQLQNGQWVPIK